MQTGTVNEGKNLGWVRSWAQGEKYYYSSVKWAQQQNYSWWHCCAHRLMDHLSLIREALFLAEDGNSYRDLQMDNAKKVRDFEVLSPQLIVFITPLPQCSLMHAEHDAEGVEDTEIVDNIKENLFPGHIAAGLHMNSPSQWQKTFTRLIKLKTQHGEKEAGTVSHFNKKLRTAAKRVKIRLLQLGDAGPSTYSRAAHALQQLTNTKWMLYFLVCVLSVIVFKREGIWSWVGVAASGRRWMGKNTIKIHCIKFSKIKKKWPWCLISIIVFFCHFISFYPPFPFNSKAVSKYSSSSYKIQQSAEKANRSESSSTKILCFKHCHYLTCLTML